MKTRGQFEITRAADGTSSWAKALRRLSETTTLVPTGSQRKTAGEDHQGPPEGEGENNWVGRDADLTQHRRCSTEANRNFQNKTLTGAAVCS